jgi:hypothetical protein
VGLSGNLADYSLAEIFQFVQEGHRTGVLCLNTNEESSKSQDTFIWFYGGKLMNYTRSFKPDGELLAILVNRNWVDRPLAESLQKELNKLDCPLGTYLKHQGILTSDRLGLLFNIRVIQPVLQLFKLTRGNFRFCDLQFIPFGESIGLSSLPFEVSLLGMRKIENWENFSNKFPDLEYGVERQNEDNLLKLSTLENKFIAHADGRKSIATIAAELNIPVEESQWLAFRMKAVNLVKEVTLATEPAKELNNIIPFPDRNTINTSNDDRIITGAGDSKPLSQSFLTNLLGFLQTKA